MESLTKEIASLEKTIGYQKKMNMQRTIPRKYLPRQLIVAQSNKQLESAFLQGYVLQTPREHHYLQ